MLTVSLDLICAPASEIVPSLTTLSLDAGVCVSSYYLMDCHTIATICSRPARVHARHHDIPYARVREAKLRSAARPESGCTGLARASDVPGSRAVSTFESCETRFGSLWPKMGGPRMEIARLVTGDSLTQPSVFLGIMRVADERRFGKSPLGRIRAGRRTPLTSSLKLPGGAVFIHDVPRNVNGKIFRSRFATAVV